MTSDQGECFWINLQIFVGSQRFKAGNDIGHWDATELVALAA